VTLRTKTARLLLRHSIRTLWLALKVLAK